MPTSQDSLEDLGFAVWGTQGGGLARCEDGKYIWFELPDWMAALPSDDASKQVIGDPIPEEWDLAPANRAAHDHMEDEDWGQE